MIEAIGITKFYGSFRAVHNVSFRVARGEVLGFLGPNGAGKSTTMKVLTTYISASEGTALVDGYDVHAQPEDVRKRLGYLPETPPLYLDMSVEDYLRFAGRARGLSGRALRDAVNRVVDDTGLVPKRKSIIQTLSKGYRQRTGIAQALIHNPPVLILDEPTSGLDPNQIIEIRNLIARLRDANKAVIFSTHILQEAAAVASRLVIINGGAKIADGTMNQLAAQIQRGNSVRLLVLGSFAGLGEALRSVPGVRFVEPLHPPEGYALFKIGVGATDDDVRDSCRDISRLVVKCGLTVCELQPTRLSLEEMFLQMLRDGGAPALASEEREEPIERRLPLDNPYNTSGPTKRMGKGNDDDDDGGGDATETAISAPRREPRDTDHGLNKTATVKSSDETKSGN